MYEYSLIVCTLQLALFQELLASCWHYSHAIFFCILMSAWRAHKFYNHLIYHHYYHFFTRVNSLHAKLKFQCNMLFWWRGNLFLSCMATIYLHHEIFFAIHFVLKLFLRKVRCCTTLWVVYMLMSWWEILSNKGGFLWESLVNWVK